MEILHEYKCPKISAWVSERAKQKGLLGFSIMGKCASNLKSEDMN
jgi:hypothetical protein